MNDDSAARCAAAVGILLVLVALFSGIICCWVNDSMWQKEATAKGHAEYVMSGTGTKWQWKDSKQPEQP